MQSKHNVRKGIASLLSVLTVGGIASANRSGLSKSQAVAATKRGKNAPRKVVKKEPLSKSQNLNSKSKKILNGKPEILSNKASTTTDGTFFSHLRGAGKEVQSAFERLSGRDRLLVIGGITEAASALLGGRGVIERVNNFTLSWLIEALREKIFGGLLTKDLVKETAEHNDDYSATEDSVEIRRQYELQQSVEELVASKWGPVFGIFAKLSYYLKDSFWDFLAAFWHGCTDELKDVRQGGVEINDNYLDDDSVLEDKDISYKKAAGIGFGNYFGIGGEKGIHNWGPRQVVMWWRSVSKMGWKRSSLNNWAYSLGAAVFNSDVRNARSYKKDNNKENLKKLINGETVISGDTA